MATRAEAAAYVDTSALIAFVDRSDTYHTLFQRLFAAPPKLITTALVVAEGHAWFLRRYDSFRALRFLAMIEDMTPLVVKSVGVDEQRGGTKMLRKSKNFYFSSGTCANSPTRRSL